eukprot:TRINITY_DN29986_c0_g1_i1.p1 TRINITY_DN29986_c0_g1~~TRINITY_DN29986_c0_g1_i1.p1  ORF type:complete len:253 (-),score=57.82 TRINITY_DN29986_c0_g1_i1:87-845(-)
MTAHEHPPPPPCDFQVTFTRRDVSESLGMLLVFPEDEWILVKDIKPTGLALEHNDSLSEYSERRICPGDVIVEVNGVFGNINDMMDRLKQDTTLMFSFQRKPPGAPPVTRSREAAAVYHGIASPPRSSPRSNRSGPAAGLEAIAEDEEEGEADGRQGPLNSRSMSENTEGIPREAAASAAATHLTFGLQAEDTSTNDDTEVPSFSELMEARAQNEEQSLCCSFSGMGLENFAFLRQSECFAKTVPDAGKMRM